MIGVKFLGRKPSNDESKEVKNKNDASTWVNNHQVLEEPPPKPNKEVVEEADQKEPFLYKEGNMRKAK